MSGHFPRSAPLSCTALALAALLSAAAYASPESPGSPLGAVLEAAIGHGGSGTAAAARSPASTPKGYSAFVPKPLREERRLSWEPKAVPEIVPGVYEFDYRRMDFRRRLVMTIDDCAPNENMARELDILAERGIQAVFFIVGAYFLEPDGQPKSASRALLRRAIEEGHELGSHGFDHSRLDQGPYRDDYARIADNLERNQAALDLCLGYHYPIRYVRPPNGAHWTPRYMVDAYLRDRGQFLINWNTTPGDWCMNYPPGDPQWMSAKTVVEVGLSSARRTRGGVLLYHGFPKSAEIMDEVLDALLDPPDGGLPFRFVPLREVLYDKYLNGLYK